MSGDKGCSRAVDFQNKISYNEVIVNVKGNIMATLKDIAKEAGVSAMTVSRVMNGNSRAVSEQTARKVRRIAEELGYVPNSSARALVSHSSRLIAALLTEEEQGRSPLSDGYNGFFFGELARQIQRQGYDLMLHYIKDYQEINYSLKSWNVAGAVFIGLFDDNIREIKEHHHIPLIFTDSYSSVRRIANVGIDDFHGGELAAEHFLAKGHQKVAFVGPQAVGNGLVMQRLQGFAAKLKQAGAELMQRHIFCQDGQKMEEILQILMNEPDPVTGIFATSDSCAVEILGAAYRLEYKIPEELSVIGFDDLPISSQTVPPLTTIRQDIVRKAEITCQLLMKHIQDLESPMENVVLDVELKERGSVSERG